MRCGMTLLLALALVFSSWASHAEALKVRVGVYQNSPKIFIDQDGKAAGILVDMLRQIAEEENWDLSFTACKWVSCLDQLQRGEIDLLPDVAYSAARAKRFDFH